MASYGRRRAVTVLRAACALFSGLLAVALAAETAQAGSTYRYCRSTQQVMSSRCCPAPPRQAPQHAPIIGAWGDCCELRAAPMLAPYLSQPRSAEVSAPAALAAAALPAPAPIRVSAESAAPALAMRTGPPPTRARARLMVFLI